MSSPEAPLAEGLNATTSETQVPIQEVTTEPSEAEPAKAKKAKVAKPRAPDTFVREPGKSVLPFSRVQKILKADKDLVMVQREAAFLISRATEEFVGRFAEAAQKLAAKEGRSTIQPKDIVVTVRRAEEFVFLEELFPWSMLEQQPSATTDTSKNKQTTKTEHGPMDDYAYVSKPSEDDTQNVAEGDGPGNMDFVMQEDGTMVVIPTEPSS
ncbi:histone-fold-containing protein [Lenzites betulinus]|nr:histone-fold-containing protein [Lenzites betulinus]